MFLASHSLVLSINKQVKDSIKPRQRILGILNISYEGDHLKDNNGINDLTSGNFLHEALLTTKL